MCQKSNLASTELNTFLEHKNRVHIQIPELIPQDGCSHCCLKHKTFNNKSTQINTSKIVGRLGVSAPNWLMLH